MNPYVHSMGVANGVGARTQGVLRHSRAHRAKLRAIAAAKVTVIRADMEISETDRRSPSEVMRELADWTRRRGGRLLRVDSCKVGPSMSHPFGGWHFVQVIEVRGLVALPATVNGWKLAKATEKDIAWVQTGKNQ